ncbi:MAG TPA: hypothetical protein VMX13_13645 [Sedimentisphaerales bacterium]|jgi:hypothetical protein|nr:hypothetical protein [Sedimentisphaerales bacterium]
MKKFIFVAAVLLLAAPTWAMDVWCTADGCDVTVSFSGAAAGPVRGMAFNVELSGTSTLSNVVCLSADYGYQIFPGSIQIDGSGNVTGWGDCKCSGSYPGTLDAANAMTIEMGSLYEAGVEDPPAADGNLVSFRVDGGTGIIQVHISVNEIRGGVVNEDASTTVPIITDCNVEKTVPDCWTLTECAGQPLGDGTCDGAVNFLDLNQLKLAFFATKGQPLYNCCADYNHDNAVNFLDLNTLKLNFFSTGHTPATLNQNCPP